MERRSFLLKAGGALVGAGATVMGCRQESKTKTPPQVITRRKHQWRMVTTWTPALDVLQGNAQRFASMVESMSDGELKIQVYAAGELVPALGAFDACQRGPSRCSTARPTTGPVKSRRHSGLRRSPSD